MISHLMSTPFLFVLLTTGLTAARGWRYVENIGDSPVLVLLVEVKSAKQ